MDKFDGLTSPRQSAMQSQQTCGRNLRNLGKSFGIAGWAFGTIFAACGYRQRMGSSLSWSAIQARGTQPDVSGGRP